MTATFHDSACTIEPELTAGALFCRCRRGRAFAPLQTGRVKGSCYVRRMKGRLLTTLLVLGVARPARADEAASITVAPLPAAAPAPAFGVVEPIAPAIGVVEPIGSPPPPVSHAVGPLVAGVLTAFVPFVVGCALWSNSDRGDLENAGSYVMAAGFAAAPWVSHGLQRRWKRAAVFGSVSAATSAATLIAMEAKDPFYAPYANRQRVAFGMLLTSAMFASAIGLLDSFRAAPARETP